MVAMLSLETMGYFKDEPGTQNYPFPLNLFYSDTGNFIGFVGDLSSRSLVHEVVASFRSRTRFPSEGVVLPTGVQGVGWSDHWSFWQHGYPAVMVTDTALFRYPHYHTAQDTADKVDTARLARVVAGLVRVIGDVSTRESPGDCCGGSEVTVALPTMNQPGADEEEGADGVENGSGAFAQLCDMAATKFDALPPEMLATHVLATTEGADWPVQLAAMQAVLRRLRFAQRDELKIAQRPARRQRLGMYATRGAGRNSRRPYHTLLYSVEPLYGSCDCRDFSRSSLGAGANTCWWCWRMCLPVRVSWPKLVARECTLDGRRCVGTLFVR